MQCSSYAACLTVALAATVLELLNLENKVSAGNFKPSVTLHSIEAQCEVDR
jgi:hypothetical protein